MSVWEGFLKERPLKKLSAQVTVVVMAIWNMSYSVLINEKAKSKTPTVIGVNSYYSPVGSLAIQMILHWIFHQDTVIISFITGELAQRLPARTPFRSDFVVNLSNSLEV